VDTAIRTTTSPRQAHEWALVLSATGIPHRVQPGMAGWTVLVFAADAARAQGALDAYDEESRPDPGLAAPDSGSRLTAWTVGVVTGALLLGFFAVAGPPATGSCWFARGAAVAGLMRSSEPWRALTALCLHADGMHAIGNALATSLLLPAVVRSLGPGLGLGLALVAGTGANLLAALIHPALHVSVGASTAIFGMIGILAALRFRLAPGRRETRGGRWVIPVATLLLLTMLGTAQGADVLGHTLGLLVGVGIGLLAARQQGTLPLTIQWALVGLAVGLVVGAWRFAGNAVASLR